MATLKHIASKNSDYTAIEAYLIYQHDEFTGKQLLDEQGKPKLRESYLLDTLECGDFSFATACLLANRKYGKNTQHGDIKSHQYIISFDPRDAADNGLTMEKAQALGLKFCEENFPGHPAIVCTHPDGHNHSGNIHVHIVIGSIRMREVERKPYMQKPRDWCEGMKHSSTAQTMRHLRVEVMELCEGAGLYQIDLLNGSKVRVSEREYWMKQRGQLKLDHENAALLATGQQPTQTKFETAKEVLRRQISEVLNVATSFEDFSDRLLQQYGITVKESRGRLSYLPAGRTKFIRARSIGDKFEKELVLAALKANTERKRTIQSKSDRIGKLIDIQAKLKQGKGIGYERWAKKHNLKTMAQILILLQDKGLLNEDALDQRIAELDTKFHESLAVVKDLETRMAENKTLRSHAAAYKQYRPLAQKRNAAKSPAAFEEQHRVELTAYRAAAAYLKANNITSLPSPNKLESEYCALASEKAQFYEQYKEAKSELLKLKDAKQNVALFFREEKTDAASRERRSVRMINLKIDPEFQNQIPPLTDDEYRQLEENILKEGKLLSPLIVWNNTLVDGHNRYAILQKHPEICFSTMPLRFESREEVLAWICKNQLGRRNLTPEQKLFLIGKQYEAEKSSHGEARKESHDENGRFHRSSQTDNSGEAIKTCERIAEENGVSKATVLRASKYMKGVEIAESLIPGMREKILNKQVKVSKSDMHRLARANYDARAQTLQEILHPELKVEPKPDADGIIREPGKAPVMPFQKIESVYDSDAYPEEVRHDYVALEHVTTRFRTEFDYLLRTMPDTAQREVILEIIHKHKEYLDSLESALAEDEQTA